MEAIAHAVIECLKDDNITRVRDMLVSSVCPRIRLACRRGQNCYTHELCMYTAAAMSAMKASPVPVDYLPSGIWSTPLIQYSFFRSVPQTTTIPGTNPKISGTRSEEFETCRYVQDQMSGASHMLRHVL